MALLTYLPLYLKEVMAFSPFWASQALALAQMGGMVGRVGWGVISDRAFGGQRKAVLVGIGIGSVALLGLLGLVTSVTSPVILLSLIFLSGVCMIGYQGVSYALIGELAGSARTGAALGIVISVNSLGARPVRMRLPGALSGQPCSSASWRSNCFSQKRRQPADPLSQRLRRL
jgi:sugar phosphate permease